MFMFVSLIYGKDKPKLCIIRIKMFCYFCLFHYMGCLGTPPYFFSILQRGNNALAYEETEFFPKFGLLVRKEVSSREVTCFLQVFTSFFLL